MAEIGAGRGTSQSRLALALTNFHLMSQFDLSIVIVSYNVRDLLAECLRSLQSAASNLSLQVFVVDNASRDGSAEMVRADFAGVTLVANLDNRGFAAANNQALACATGRYWLLLNPDTEIRAGALETLVAFMGEHPRAGVCGPRLVYGDGTLQHSAFGFPSLAQVYLDLFPSNWRLAESRLNGRYPRSWYARGVPFPIDHPLGACLMVRAEAVAQVGLLDEGYFIYAEEVDWCMRFKRAGWEIWCVPAAEIVHHEARSTQQFRDRMYVELWKARWRLFHKHYSPRFRWAARQIIRFGLARRRRDAQHLAADERARRLQAYRSVLETISQ